MCGPSFASRPNTCRFEDLSSIPIVTREMLQSVPLEDRSSARQDRYLGNTGGSSGQPLTFYLQSNSFAHEWAHMHTIWDRIDFRPGDLRLSFLGRNVRGKIDYKAVGHHYGLYSERALSATCMGTRARFTNSRFSANGKQPISGKRSAAT
jgi:phenylacetate-coenzyme A ligase PaaK-like adenylate-forming protein